MWPSRDHSVVLTMLRNNNKRRIYRKQSRRRSSLIAGRDLLCQCHWFLVRRSSFVISRSMDLYWILCAVTSQSAFYNIPVWIANSSYLHQRKALVILKHWWPQFTAHHETVLSSFTELIAWSSSSLQQQRSTPRQEIRGSAQFSRPLLAKD